MITEATVIKLGGSIMALPQLLPWLKAIRKSRAILVPGGGIFADTVRTAQEKISFADKAAHDMAILAMTQYGIMCCSLVPGLKLFSTIPDAKSIIAEGMTPVWSPRHLAAQWHDLPHNWEVSSDTLALRLAAAINASKLILVKAAPVNRNNNKEELLDKAFAEQQAAHGQNIDISIRGADEYSMTI